MVSSSHRVFACIVFLLTIASFTHAQKDQAASISGKVTLKNKGVAGIVVVATENDYSSGWRLSHNRGTTDEDGNYRINNVPTGNYLIYPVAPALVLENGQVNQRLTVAPGETIRDINFAMVHGGVITGRITDASGQPLIEESVSVTPVELEGNYVRADFHGIQTDDRGIYRAFGLRQGKYRVSVGQSGTMLPGSVRHVFKQTFYPSVTDPEKATILEVTESSEIKDIDIVTGTGAPTSTFKITGRVIDGETGKPLPNVMLGVYQIDGNYSTSSSGGVSSNADGEFKFENAAPGKYTLFAVSAGKGDWRADPLTVDVVDRDLTGLEIKTRTGASVAGVVVRESSDDKAVALKLTDIFISASVANTGTPDFSPVFPVQANPDGSFKLTGLAAGTVRFQLRKRNNFQLNPLEIARIEQNGVPQPADINVKEGEQITGLRIVIKAPKRMGSIRGQIKLENGEPPPVSGIVIIVDRLGETSPESREGEFMSSRPEVDSRGRFLIEHLEAGTYELKVIVLQPGGYSLDEGTKQQVTVSENAVSEVTVIVKLKP
jgi:carboxypeptidase family protein